MAISVSNEAAGTEFSEEEFSEAYPPGYEHHYWHIARSAIVRDQVRSVCKKGDTVLEIGTGRGHYVRVLRSDGFYAYGCDLGTPVVHDDVQRYIFGGTDFANLDSTLRQRVTAILLLDVIEHIEQPAAFLASAFEALPALRSLIITLPARQELWSNYDEHYRHFLRYDLEKFRELARNAQLEVLTSGYFFHALYLPALAMKMMGVNRATSFAAPGNRWLHRWLGRAFWLESRILPKAIYGTSLIAVCAPERSAKQV
jgi:hypothetical protein